jgi:hypothetical protein
LKEFKNIIRKKYLKPNRAGHQSYNILKKEKATRALGNL